MGRGSNNGKFLEQWDVAMIRRVFRIKRRGFNNGKPLE